MFDVVAQEMCRGSSLLAPIAILFAIYPISSAQLSFSSFFDLMGVEPLDAVHC
jgi:hypothetical protein